MTTEAQTSQPQPNLPPQGTGPRRMDNVELHLPSVLGYEKIARRAAEAVAEQMDFARERIEDIKTAISEACMNAIEHGNNFERGQNVKVMMTIDRDRLEVRVADVGVSRIPTELPPPGSGDMRGWGMFFIRQLVDEIEITTLPGGGNQVRMVIFQNRPAPDAKVESASEKPAADTAAPASTNGSASGDVAQSSPTADAQDAVKSGPEAEIPGATAGALAPKPEQSVQVREDKPSAVQPVPEKLAAVQSVPEKPSAVQVSEAKPSAIQAAPEPAKSEPAKSGPADIESADAEPAVTKSADTKPTDSEPAKTDDAPQASPPQSSGSAAAPAVTPETTSSESVASTSQDANAAAADDNKPSPES